MSLKKLVQGFNVKWCLRESNLDRPRGEPGSHLQRTPHDSDNNLHKYVLIQNNKPIMLMYLVFVCTG